MAGVKRKYYLTLLVVAACFAHSALGSVIVCEGSSVYLSCPQGQVLIVHSGVYGRTQPGAVICPHRQIKTTSCVSTTSTAKVQSLCNGQNRCQLKASNDVFGDPCYLTVKYLELKYACV